MAPAKRHRCTRAALVRRPSGYAAAMSPDWRDEDDWVGTPPEGRHARERARPGYWRRSWPVATAATGVLGLLIVIVLVLALT